MTAIAMLTSGCFTGIESTPKITDDDVKRMTRAESHGIDYLSDVKPQNIGEWDEGKLFVATDSKVALALNISPAGTAIQRGDTLRFKKAADVTSILGKPAAEIVFSGPAGSEAVYRSDASLEELKRLDGVRLPFMIELSVVDGARKAMVGKELWVTTSDWLDKNLHPRRGRKFVNVKIIEAIPGTDVAPVAVYATELTKAPADTFALLLSVTDEISSTRRFTSQFSTTNPHLRYPAITDGMWAMICNGNVADGMTREEVRLSLGRPVSVNRRAGYSTLSEIWTYENGRYLVFEDGLLKIYR